MKIKSKSIITTALLCLISMVSMAKELSVFSVGLAGENIIALHVTNVNQPNIQVTLKDANGVTLHDETLEENNLNQRKYDLRNLPWGSYTLVVAYDNVVKVQTIKKEYGVVEIEIADLQTIYQPTFRKHAEFLDLDMLRTSEQEISVQIVDSEGHVIYSERNQSKGSFQKRFNLSKLNEGAYTVKLGVFDNGVNKEFKELINWSPAMAAL